MSLVNDIQVIMDGLSDNVSIELVINKGNFTIKTLSESIFKYKSTDVGTLQASITGAYLECLCSAGRYQVMQACGHPINNIYECKCDCTDGLDILIRDTEKNTVYFKIDEATSDEISKLQEMARLLNENDSG
jgi:hypothetical protein